MAARFAGVCLFLFVGPWAFGKCPPVTSKFPGQDQIERELGNLAKRSNAEAQACNAFAKDAEKLSPQLGDGPTDENPFFKSKSDFDKVVTKLRQYQGTPTSYQAALALLLAKVPADATLETFNVFDLRNCDDVDYFKLWKTTLGSLEKFKVEPNELEQTRNAFGKFIEGDIQRPIGLVGLSVRVSLTQLAVSEKLLNFSSGQIGALAGIQRRVSALKDQFKSEETETAGDMDEALSCEFFRRRNRKDFLYLRQVDAIRKDFVALVTQAL